MINGHKISLILPCRNEENAIKKVLLNVPKEIDEVIVVDNVSTDNTAKVAKRLKAKVLSEHRTDRGIGYGYALATGINAAQGDIIVTMDGDGSYPVSEIIKAIKFLKRNKYDFISCNRQHLLNRKKMSSIRMFGVSVLNLGVSLLYGFPIKDSLTGMWVFKKEVVPQLNLFEGGWDFSLEIKLSAITNKKIMFGEYHITYKDRELDESKQIIYKTGLQHLFFLFKWKARQFRKALLPKSSSVPLISGGRLPATELNTNIA